MANMGEAAEVLARWREVERQLAAVEDGSAEAERLQGEAAELRDQMKRLTAQAPHGLAEASA